MFFIFFSQMFDSLSLLLYSLHVCLLGALIKINQSINQVFSLIFAVLGACLGPV